TVSPASGSGSRQLDINVVFQPNLLPVQAGSITLNFIGAGNTAGPITVTFTTTTLPAVSIDQSSLTFNPTIFNNALPTPPPTPPVLTSEPAPANATWTAQANVPWLTVSPASGSGPQQLDINVQFQPGLLAAQAGAITLTFTGAGNTAGPINVTLNTTTLPAVS